MTNSKRIWVCIDGRYCCRRNPAEVLSALQESVKKHNATDRLEVVGGGCLGMCGYGPNAMVISGRRRIGYCHLTAADADAIIDGHADDDRPVERLRIKRNSNPS